MSCSRKRGRKALPPPGCAIMAIKRRLSPMETNAESPGLLQATGCAEQLQRLEDAAAADVERIQCVYREIERRDGAANWHAALWFRFACLLAVVLIVCISAIVYFAMQASKVQAFVQPVQITEDGKMVLVGLPKDPSTTNPRTVRSWICWRSGSPNGAGGAMKRATSARAMTGPGSTGTVVATAA